MNGRTLAAITTVLILTAFVWAPSGAADPNGGPKRYIVGFNEMPRVSEGDAYPGGHVVETIPGLGMAVVSVADYGKFHARALSDSNVRYVELDNPAYAVIQFVPNDSLYGNAGHYGSKIIGGETAWDTTQGTTAVKVAVLDTGLRKTHEDITGTRVLQGKDVINNDNDPNDEGGPCAYHGTHTTGTALATINNAKGIAGLSQSAILPVKIFKKANNGPFGCSTTTTAIVNGLKYAGDQGAHVSSNSWGGGGSSTSINDAIQYAHDRGTIHVAAAGNAGACTNCVSQPWKDKAAITIVVSCSTSNDAFCSFSSEGPQVDLAAPGASILSLDGSADNKYKSLSGTSMSTPHVSGVAALVKTLNPAFTFADVEGRLKDTATNLGLSTDKQGAGRLNAAGAAF